MWLIWLNSTKFLSNAVTFDCLLPIHQSRHWTTWPENWLSRLLWSGRQVHTVTWACVPILKLGPFLVVARPNSPCWPMGSVVRYSLLLRCDDGKRRASSLMLRGDPHLTWSRVDLVLFHLGQLLGTEQQQHLAGQRAVCGLVRDLSK